jgi:hypothetical protein
METSPMYNAMPPYYQPYSSYSYPYGSYGRAYWPHGAGWQHGPHGQYGQYGQYGPYGQADYANWNRPWEYGPRYPQYSHWMAQRSPYGWQSYYAPYRYGSPDAWMSYGPYPATGYAPPPYWWNEYRPMPAQEYVAA